MRNAQPQNFGLACEVLVRQNCSATLIFLFHSSNSRNTLPKGKVRTGKKISLQLLSWLHLT